MMQNRFNLIDEPWVPIADVGLVGLNEIFKNPDLRMLGGSPTEKIAILKLLLAIAQSAYTPENDTAWKELGASELAARCAAYLQEHHDAFFLYGDNPFLQLLSVAKAELKSFGTIIPSVATGNTTLLTQIQVERSLADSQKAILLVTQMGFALGGKKPDNSIILTPGYRNKTNEKNKPSTSKPGSSVGHMGLLHSFCLGDSLHKTIWFNLLTQEDISGIGIFSEGLGRAPWEEMPAGEACIVAEKLKNSYLGRLIPLGRFCLFTDTGVHLTEGIQHVSYKEGIFDPSVAINADGKEVKALWVNPEKRPWREVTAFLSFIAEKKGGFSSVQLKSAIRKISAARENFAIWSGGLSVSSNAGEQYVAGGDDNVESSLWFDSNVIDQIWFSFLEQEIIALDKLSKLLYGCILAYNKEMLKDNVPIAGQASNLFWQFAEKHSQQLIDECDDSNSRFKMRKKFASYVEQIFSRFCPSTTAREMDAWAKCRPKLYDYLKQENV